MRLISLLPLAALLVLPAACTDNSEDGPAESTQTLTLIASWESFVEVNRGVTRSLPDGYVSYNTLYPRTTPEHTTIGVFMTPDRVDASQDFIYMGLDPSTHLPTNKWTSNVRINEGETYYMYGFMPKEDAQGAVVESLNGDYANGARLTIQGLNTLTPADVCLIVGVKKGVPDNNGFVHIIEDSGVQLGSFKYEGGPDDTNYVYLLLKHIYAGLHFKAHLDANYAKLRSIKATKFELIAENINEYINLDVTITANTTGEDPITSIAYNSVSNVSRAAIQMFPWEGSAEELDIPVTTPESFLSCFAPGSCNEFILRTTYNVYDTNGNLVRNGCVAENRINSLLIPNIANLSAGDIYTIDMLIKPTYLYMLSEPDLDNPTITLTATTTL